MIVARLKDAAISFRFIMEVNGQSFFIMNVWFNG
jgi:hypothetical protein